MPAPLRAVPESEPTPETRSRAAFEVLGGPMTDREWKDADRRLAEFFRIAAEWADNPAPEKKTA